MVGTIDESKKKVVINAGAFGYNAEILASLLDEEVKDVLVKMKPGGEYWKLYNKGRNMAKYRIDEKLFELACSGNLDAMRQFINTRE